MARRCAQGPPGGRHRSGGPPSSPSDEGPATHPGEGFCTGTPGGDENPRAQAPGRAVKLSVAADAGTGETGVHRCRPANAGAGRVPHRRDGWRRGVRGMTCHPK